MGGMKILEGMCCKTFCLLVGGYVNGWFPVGPIPWKKDSGPKKKEEMDRYMEFGRFI
jgi:hypothetical protein